MHYELPCAAAVPQKDYLYSASNIPRLIKTAAVETGTRLEIYWPQEKRYYKATVKTERPRKRENYLICYDEKKSIADREWIDLHRHKFRILDAPATKINMRKPSPMAHLEHPKEVVVVKQQQHPDENDDSGSDSWTKPMTKHLEKEAKGQCEATSNLDDENRNVASHASHTAEKTVTEDIDRRNDDISPQTVPSLRGAMQAREEEPPNSELTKPSEPVANTRECDVGLIVAEIGEDSERDNIDVFSPCCVLSSRETSHAREDESSKAVSRVSDDVALKKSASAVIADAAFFEHSSPGSSTGSRSIKDFKCDVVSPVLVKSCVVNEQSAIDDSKPVRIVSDGTQANSDYPFSSGSLKPETKVKSAVEINECHVLESKVGEEVEAVDAQEDESGMSDSKECDLNGDDDAEEGVIIDPEGDPATIAVVCSLIEVGSRVSVFWDDEQRFYTGTVTDRKFRGKPFYLEYDDGEEEWIDLRKHRFRLLQTKASPRKHDNCESRNTRRRFSNREGNDSTEKIHDASKTIKACKKGNASPHSNVKSGEMTATAELPSKPRVGRPKTSEKLPKDERKQRKTALDALAEKQRKRSPAIITSEKSSHSFSNDECDDSDRDAYVESKKRPLGRKDRVDEDIAKITVGTRVSVWWDGDKQYYSGIVQRERNHKKPFFLVYDDGEEKEWIDFRQHKFKLLPNAPPEKKKRGRPKREDNFRPDDIKKIKVGSRVAVWWTSVSKYYEGTVTRERKGDKPFFIEYDVGEAGHWIDFSKHTFRLLGKNISGAKNDPSKKRKQKEESKECNSDDDPTDSKVKVKKWRRSSNSNESMTDAGKQESKAISSPKSEKKQMHTLEWKDLKDGFNKQEVSGDDISLGITVGTSVAVYWEGDSKYYEGVVTRERKNSKKRHYLEYDDGEAAHWIDFKEHWVQVLPDKEPTRKKRNTNAGSKVNHPGKDLSKGRQRGKPKPAESSDLSDIKVGSRVEIWWSGDERFYKGTVTRAGAQKFFVEYDDGEEEWVSVSQHTFRLLAGGEKEESEDEGEISDKEDEQKENPDDAAPDDASAMDSIDSKDHLEYDDFVYGNVDKVHVGSRLAVWWPGEKKYFDGTVRKIDDSRKPYFIEYDDDDEEWTDLRRRYFRFLD